MSQQKEPYKVCMVRNSIVVVLSEGHSVPYLADCVASKAAGVGVDITDPCQYDVWEGAALCWNVLEQRHEFHNPTNLTTFEGNPIEGYIPFDHATGQLRAVLSLLKFSQDKCYSKKIFSTELPQAVDPA